MASNDQPTNGMARENQIGNIMETNRNQGNRIKMNVSIRLTHTLTNEK